MFGGAGSYGESPMLYGTWRGTLATWARVRGIEESWVKNSGSPVFNKTAPTSKARELDVGNTIIPAAEGLSGGAHCAMAAYGARIR